MDGAPYHPRRRMQTVLEELEHHDQIPAIGVGEDH
jgi:hypothetical protein